MSRKSITSATVVPTACEDQNDNSSLPLDVLDRNVEANQEAMTTLTPAPTTDLATTEGALQIAAGIQDTTAEVPTSTDSEDHPVQQSSPPKPFPLPLSHGIPQNVELTDRGGFKLVNNYRALATTFKHLQPFARSPDGTYSAEIACVLCDAATPTSVFFPCQHMCVCNYCIATNDMSPECSLNLERCVCPVCSADIGIILPHTGTEEDTYWKWVLATKPRLPSQFTKDFKNAVQKISDSSLMEGRRSTTIGAITPNPSNEPSEATKQPNRQRSWGPSNSRRRSAYMVDPSRKQETCLIL